MGENEFCGTETDTHPQWTPWDLIRWKLVPSRLGGGAEHLNRYKDSWIIHNKTRIIESARSNKFPAILLASVLRTEVGGTPDIIDHFSYPIRSFDWSGSDWVDRHLTITKAPETTSVGPGSIQLQNAAAELGLNWKYLSIQSKDNLFDCLTQDTFNIEIIAKHIRSLILYDYPGTDTLNITDEQFIVAGSRYNRGTKRDLKDIINSINVKEGSADRAYSEYGRAMMKHKPHVQALLDGK